MLTRTQAAYLAGAIDGEGHLGIIRIGPRGRYANATFSARISVTNTNLGWLERLQTWIGGRINRTDSKKRRNRRPCYDLRLNDRGSIQACLTAIQPFLILKQAHAGLLFQYFGIASRRASGQKGIVSDPAIVAELQVLYLAVQQINLRGKVQDWSLERPQFNRKCQIDGCARPHMGRGYCKQHYKKYIERGGPAWHELTCARCGKPFTSKRSDARSCSSACASAHYHAQHPRTVLKPE